MNLQAIQNRGSYVDYLEVERRLQKEELPGVPIRVAILRNFTIEPLLPVISGEMALLNRRSEFYVGGYESSALEPRMTDPPFLQSNPDYLLVLQWFPTGMDEGSSTLVETLQLLRERTAVPIICGANRDLSEWGKGISDLFFIDWTPLLRTPEMISVQQWEQKMQPFAAKVIVPVGRAVSRYFRPLLGLTKKVLVLDCDNTLWGGVIGEEGLAGIQLFEHFQEQVLKLRDDGILLALCSKNNPEDVWQVFDSHPHSKLKCEDFAAAEISWEDKATGLRRIASRLNVGIDSLVYVDDSAFECNWIRTSLPEVSVICLTGEPGGFPNQLHERGYFLKVRSTPEDRLRHASTVASQRVHQMGERFRDELGQYLCSLGMKARVARVGKKEVPRVSELTQKTNQFNLTTIRYSQNEILRLLDRPDYGVFFLSLEDKETDHGIVGVAILKYKMDAAEPRAEIDTFLLSCRVLGRSVEHAFLQRLIEEATRHHCCTLIGRYIPTSKNAQVSEFYTKNGFTGRQPYTMVLRADSTLNYCPSWIEMASWPKAKTISSESYQPY